MPLTLTDMRRPYPRWTARAWINGQAVTLTQELPVRTLSSLRARSTCVLNLLDLAPAGGGLTASVDLILNNTTAIRFFTGKTDQRGGVSARMERTANLVDFLNLDKAVPSEITWSSRSFPDAVRDLLGAAGITAADIDSVFNPGSAYTLGPVYPIKITTQENVAQALNELLEFGGVGITVTPSGRVRVVDSPGIPAATSLIVYARGANLAAGEFGIVDAGYSVEGNETIVSSFTATGPKRPDGQIPDGTFVAASVVGVPATQSYRFLQTDAAAQVIARRECGRRARARANLWLEAPLNPLLQPGDTILLQDAAIGYPTPTPVVITEMATTADAGMRLQLSAGASLLDGYSSSISPPEADFSTLIEQQLITLAGVPVTRAFVQCRDQSRDRGGRSITSRAWSATGPDVTPTSSSAANPIFFFSATAGAEITLTVVSESGESATLTRKVQAQETQILNRLVSVASSAGWKVLGKDGWKTFVHPTNGVTCTAVPSFNEKGPLLSGWSNGAVYSSANGLASAPTLLSTLAGRVGCLFVNEANPNHVLAGHGNTLSRSTNGGKTWTALRTFAAPVRDAQSSPANVSEIRVCAGSEHLISFNGGGSWAVLAAGLAGTEANALATAPWGRAAVFSDPQNRGSLADYVKFEEGYTVDWGGVGVDVPTGGLTSITALLNEEAFFVSAAPDMIRDGTLEDLTLFASTSAGATVWKLTRSAPNTGTSYTAAVHTQLSSPGPGKIIGGNNYPIDNLGATSIGYGPIGAIPPGGPDASIVFVAREHSGAGEGIWHYTGGAWVNKPAPITGPLIRPYVAVNPANPNEWLFFANKGNKNEALLRAQATLRTQDGSASPLWYSPDAGATWQAISLSGANAVQPLPISGTTGDQTRDAFYAHPEWSPVGNSWAFAVSTLGGSGRLVIWRGTGATAQAPIVSSTMMDLRRTTNSTRGPKVLFSRDGDIVIRLGEPNNFDLARPTVIVPFGASSITTPAGATVKSTIFSGVVGPSNAWYGLDASDSTNANLLRSSNVRTVQPSQVGGVSGLGSMLAVVGSTIIVAVNTVRQITDINGPAPVLTTLAAPNPTDLRLLVGDAGNTCCVGYALQQGYQFYDGTAWTLIPFPTGVPADKHGLPTLYRG